MKFTCSRVALLDAMKIASAAVAARTTRPILSNVKAAASGDSLTLTAQDMEIGIRYTLRGVEVMATGEAILAADRLTAIVATAQDADVTVEANDDGAKASVGASRFEMPGYPVNEFPDLPEWDAKHDAFELPAGHLLRAVENVAWASDKKDSTRFALSGTLLEANGALLGTIATDSKVLAIDEAKLSFPIQKKVSALIPAKAVVLLSRMLTDAEELVRVLLRPNEAMFQTERAMIYTRLVEGRYPPYRDIVSQTTKMVKHKIPLPAAVFLAKVKQAAVMTDDETKRLDMEFTDGVCELRAKSAERGSSCVKMPVEFTGAARIAFDPMFVVNMLRNANDADVVTMEMTDESKPALFRCGDGCQVLIMPLAG